MMQRIISPKPVLYIFMKQINIMKQNKSIYLLGLLLITFSSCRSQELQEVGNVYELKKEISKASLRKLAFYECLNSSVNDSLTIKIKDSSADNLYYRLYGFDPMSNPNQRPYIDSLINFAKGWGSKPYPNQDHPDTKMHITTCLNMYESYDLEKLITHIFNESVDTNLINDDIKDLEEKNSDPSYQYKYYDLYKNLSQDEKK